MDTPPGEGRRDTWATGRLLSTAARLVEHSWNTRLREEQVSHAGLIVLHLVARGPMTGRELATAQALTEQTVARTLAHLEGTGHVVRRTDPRDRRQRLVELTDAGRQLLGRLSGEGDEFVDTLLRDSGQDPAVFRAALLALLDRWSEHGQAWLPPAQGGTATSPSGPRADQGPDPLPDA